MAKIWIFAMLLETFVVAAEKWFAFGLDLCVIRRFSSDKNRLLSSSSSFKCLNIAAHLSTRIVHLLPVRSQSAPATNSCNDIAKVSSFDWAVVEHSFRRRQRLHLSPMLKCNGASELRPLLKGNIFFVVVVDSCKLIIIIIFVTVCIRRQLFTLQTV